MNTQVTQDCGTPHSSDLWSFMTSLLVVGEGSRATGSDGETE